MHPAAQKKLLAQTGADGDIYIYPDKTGAEICAVHIQPNGERTGYNLTPDSAKKIKTPSLLFYNADNIHARPNATIIICVNEEAADNLDDALRAADLSDRFVASAVNVSLADVGAVKKRHKATAFVRPACIIAPSGFANMVAVRDAAKNLDCRMSSFDLRGAEESDSLGLHLERAAFKSPPMACVPVNVAKDGQLGECFAVDSKNQIIKNTANIARALCGFANSGVIFAKNDFSGAVEIHTPAGERQTLFNKILTPGMNEVDEAVVIACKAALEDLMFWSSLPTSRVYDGIAFLAQINAYHPVLQWLEQLEWDGERRLQTWIADYCGLDAETPSDLASAYGACFLRGAVARIYEPACDFQHILIFEGRQGLGKSPAIESLFGNEWTAAVGLTDRTDAGMVEKMAGAWGIELDEMEGFNKKDDDAMKALLSRNADKVRLAFRRDAVSHRRQCVFTGTTNKFMYLTDTTGAKRYWPVRLQGVVRGDVSEINHEALKRDRNQLFAEAVVDYKQNPASRFLPIHLRGASNNHAMKRFIGTATLSRLQSKRTQGLLFPSETMASVLRILDIPAAADNQRRQHEIVSAMQFMGYQVSHGDDGVQFSLRDLTEETDA